MNPNPETSEEPTPDGQVATVIVRALSAAGLIAPSQIGKVYAGLAAGTFKAEDWRFIAEQTLALEARNGKTAH